MSKKTLPELKSLVATRPIPELRTLKRGDPQLSKQLKFSVPARSSIRRQDLARLERNETCVAWGQDPTTGKWVCLKWE